MEQLRPTSGRWLASDATGASHGIESVFVPIENVFAEPFRPTGSYLRTPRLTIAIVLARTTIHSTLDATSPYEIIVRS